jgi:hypothetical protein
MKAPFSTCFDVLGITASSLCVVHCLGSVVLSIAVPVAGFTPFVEERFHRVIAVFVLVAGFAAFVPGFKRHRCWAVLTVGSLGMAAIALTQLMPDVEEYYELMLTLLGGGFLVLAHWQNRVLCHECQRSK